MCAEDTYDCFLSFGVGITNFNVFMHKQRDDDNEWFNWQKYRIDSLGKEKKRKRLEQQSKHDLKRQIRLEGIY